MACFPFHLPMLLQQHQIRGELIWGLIYERLVAVSDTGHFKTYARVLFSSS